MQNGASNDPQQLAAARNRFESAKSLHRLGRLDEAERCYHSVLQIDAYHADTMHGLGLVFLQRGRFDEAIHWLGEAIKCNPDSAALYDHLGSALAGAKRFDEAIHWLSEAVRRDPGSAVLYNNLGFALASAKRFAEAVEVYRKSLAIAPNAAPILSSLGYVLNLLGRNEEALAALRKAVALTPNSFEANANLGNCLMALNRHEEARACHEKTIALNPRPAETYNKLGVTLSQLGRNEEAIVQFEKALARAPDYTAALCNLGNTLGNLGRYESAAQCFERALALEPGFDIAHYNYGKMLSELKRHEEAASHYRKAIAINPDYAIALNNLGSSLNALERHDEALAAYERALVIEPNHVLALGGAGNTLLYLGRIEEARRFLERAVALAPRSPVCYRNLTQAKTFRADDPQIAALEQMTKDEMSFSEADRVELHFALAKIYADLGRHDLVFAQLQKGNSLKRRLVDYDEAGELGVFRHTAALFTPELIEAKRGMGDPSDVPVFILGMPRSGTTLVEQVLASHPQVFGAGELMDFGLAVIGGHEADPLPVDAASLSGDDLKRLGGCYLSKVLPKALDAKRITDKMPANFRFAGLIHLALPNARIIHVRRDPCDTCFSCYTKLFPLDMNFVYDLGELGRYYKAYEALMAHWRAVLPAGAMLEVQYEELVDDFEAEARKIVEYCGLEWDARCLSFHKTERSVHTASAFQVRQPLFKSGVGRARPYAEWLGPLREALDL